MPLLPLLLALLLPTPAAAATVGDLFDGLEALVPAVAASPATRADFEALATDHGLARDESAYLTYVRVRIAFEATRAGGLWHARWAITDQEPRSDRLWQAWATGDSDDAVLAECDELSALFGVVARELGVADVGLFWPTWNHTVAVWTAPAADGGTHRIVVPTSQVFLDPEDTLGTRAFDPSTQRTIHRYGRVDVRRDAPLEDGRLRTFLAQVEAMAPASASVLQALRNLRELRSGGLVGASAVVRYLDERLQPLDHPQDLAAVGAFRREIDAAR